MESKTEIKKIVLDLGGKEVTLTVEQARKLKEILSDMFGREIIKEVIHEHHKVWDWYCTYSYYVSGTSAKEIKYADNVVYCSVK